MQGSVTFAFGVKRITLQGMLVIPHCAGLAGHLDLNAGISEYVERVQSFRPIETGPLPPP